MKFTNKTDINASVNDTFAGLADFEHFERQALRSGAEVARVDALGRPGQGMIWALRFVFRGKVQKINAELVDYDPPNMMVFSGVSDSFDAVVQFDLLALSARETRVTVSIDMKPKSLAARLILQSARLTKGSINKRFRNRLNRFGTELENRIRSA